MSLDGKEVLEYLISQQEMVSRRMLLETDEDELSYLRTKFSTLSRVRDELFSGKYEFVDKI